VGLTLLGELDLDATGAEVREPLRLRPRRVLIVCRSSHLLRCWRGRRRRRVGGHETSLDEDCHFLVVCEAVEISPLEEVVEHWRFEE